jgi:hypothetical protein
MYNAIDSVLGREFACDSFTVLLDPGMEMASYPDVDST